jgi:CcmD family protein
MTTEAKYVFAAYSLVFVVVLIYVVIIALKLVRLDRQVRELELPRREAP